MKSISIVKLVASLYLLGNCYGLAGQIYFDTARSVKMFSTITDEGDININWVPDPEAESHTLWSKGTNDTEWDSIALFSATDSTYQVANFAADQLKEYRVIKKAGDINGYGYLLTGRELAAQHVMGRLLILIESETHTQVEEKLDAYRNTLLSEGWLVDVLTVGKNAAVAHVKQMVIDHANSHTDLRALLLLGDVPVPHSGDINPDAHLNHKGAWSADLYYGDLDGTWTDTDVDNTSSDNIRNHNIPGDGNLDQSYIPSDIELEVGRVDFSELPAFTEDEFQLLENYLQKDIDYRTKVFTPIPRAAMMQTNQWNGGLGQNGFRNFSTLVGPDSISTNIFYEGFTRSYQWFYGGGSGSYTSATFMGTTSTFAVGSLQFVFTSFFGSYFGDYDYEDNFMRAALGSGTVLTSAWVGAPNWFYHPMGMGRTIGYCTRLTQNNLDTYSGDFFPRGVHVNLLGDPTLKSYIVAPPTQLLLSEVAYGVELNWTASAEADGYHIYRKPTDSTGYYEHIGTRGITTFTDFCPAAGDYDYLVRVEKLEVTPSGSFYNLSSGAASTITVSGQYPVTADFDIIEQDGQFVTSNSSTGATGYTWILPSGLILLAEDVSFDISVGNPSVVTLIASNPCKSDTITKEIISTNTLSYNSAAVSVYPNPVHDVLTIVSEEWLTYTIHDPAGAVVRQFASQANDPIQVDLSHLATGIYTLKCIGNSSSDHVRFMKL